MDDVEWTPGVDALAEPGVTAFDGFAPAKMTI